jgi:signal peptidase II
MYYLLLGFVVVVLDQATKFMIQTKMSPWQSISVLPGWFSITFVENFGAAFGILQSKTFLLIGMTIVVLLVVWFNRRQLHKFPRVFRVGLALAIGGSLGNFVDRVRLGYVVDFFDFHVWPVFNVADMGIVCGVGLIILGMFGRDLFGRFPFHPRPAGKQSSEEEHS